MMEIKWNHPRTTYTHTVTAHGCSSSCPDIVDSAQTPEVGVIKQCLIRSRLLINQLAVCIVKRRPGACVSPVDNCQLGLTDAVESFCTPKVSKVEQ